MSHKTSGTQPSFESACIMHDLIYFSQIFYSKLLQALWFHYNKLLFFFEIKALNDVECTKTCNTTIYAESDNKRGNFLLFVHLINLITIVVVNFPPRLSVIHVKTVFTPINSRSGVRTFALIVAHFARPTLYLLLLTLY